MVIWKTVGQQRGWQKPGVEKNSSAYSALKTKYPLPVQKSPILTLLSELQGYGERYRLVAPSPSLEIKEIKLLLGSSTLNYLL